MEVPVRANLTSLFELQKVDKEIQALEEMKGDLPQQVEKLKRESDEIKKICENKKAELNEVKKNRALREVELKSFEDKLAKYKEQLYAVTSNKEYDAITLEIDAIAEKISTTEDEILKFIDQEDELSNSIRVFEPQIASLEENLNKKTNELKEKIAATEKEYESCKRHRDEISNSIKHQVLYQYERIRKGVGNSAVANIVSNACGSCFTTIPPQKLVEIKMMNELILCESCGRILIHINEKQTVLN